MFSGVCLLTRGGGWGWAIPPGLWSQVLLGVGVPPIPVTALVQSHVPGSAWGWGTPQSGH